MKKIHLFIYLFWKEKKPDKKLIIVKKGMSS